MIIKAKKNISESGTINVTLIKGEAEKIPFRDNSLDVVTCMVAPHITSEVFRVLKPNGIAILEKIGDRDKWNFKQEFDCDSQGLRGQFSSLSKGDRAVSYKHEFGNLFSEVLVKNEFWKTYYSMEGLILLLEQTPTIRNFDRKLDSKALIRIQQKYLGQRGIETEQNKILIVAKK